jgi:hypothetical protein
MHASRKCGRALSISHPVSMHDYYINVRPKFCEDDKQRETKISLIARKQKKAGKGEGRGRGKAGEGRGRGKAGKGGGSEIPLEEKNLKNYLTSVANVIKLFRCHLRISWSVYLC